MLLDYEIKEILDIIDSAKECSITISSQYSTVANINLSKSDGAIYSINTYIPRNELKAYIESHRYDYHAFKINSLVSEASCQHEWVDVGFHFTKLVCRICDKSK